MKIYDKIKDLLVEDLKYRNSDKEMFWRVLEDTEKIKNGYLSKQNFMTSVSFESCRRCRQKIQELHPELQATRRVRAERRFVENQRGTHIFRDLSGVQERFV